MLAIYCPIYVYTAIVLYFIALIATSAPSNSTPSIGTFQRANSSAAVRVLFILTLASMLGTPPTLGFFAKLLTFYLLVQNPGVALFAALMLTLILLVFYLQAVRTANTLRKKAIWAAQTQEKSLIANLILGQSLFALFTVSAIYVFDIAYCFFI